MLLEGLPNETKSFVEPSFLEILICSGLFESTHPLFTVRPISSTENLSPALGLIVPWLETQERESGIVSSQFGTTCAGSTLLSAKLLVVFAELLDYHNGLAPHLVRGKKRS